MVAERTETSHCNGGDLNLRVSILMSEEARVLDNGVTNEKLFMVRIGT